MKPLYRHRRQDWKRDKNFIIDDALSLVSVSSLCVGIWNGRKKIKKIKKFTASCLGNTIDWAGKLFGEMIVSHGNMLLFEFFFV